MELIIVISTLIKSMHKLAGTKDGVVQTGTVNLHFLIPGTSEPITATVSELYMLYCEVPDNIYTPPLQKGMEIPQEVRGGGSQRPNHLNE